MRRIGARQLAESGGWHVTDGNTPVCGCEPGESHETAEDAEIHHYETALAGLTVEANIVRSPTQAYLCVVCDSWTPWHVRVLETSPLSSAHIPVCRDHVPDDESLRDLVRLHRQFVAGLVSYVS